VCSAQYRVRLLLVCVNCTVQIETVIVLCTVYRAVRLLLVCVQCTVQSETFIGVGTVHSVE